MGTITESLPTTFVDKSPGSNNVHSVDSNERTSTLRPQPPLPGWGEDHHLLPAVLRPREPPPSQSAQPAAAEKEGAAAARPSKVLAAARYAIVVGWSSMGLGHTARCFAPVLLAAEDGTLSAGDVVVVHVPLPWGNEQKQLSANKTLNDFRLSLQKKGIHVALIRTDKTVRADYIGPGSYVGKEGHSNNVAAAFGFAAQPYRKVPAPIGIEWDDLFARTAGMGESLDQAVLDTLPVVTANSLVAQLGASANLAQSGPTQRSADSPIERKHPWIAVLTDMAPDLAKAAVNAKLWSVSQANHANLFTLPSDDSPQARRKATEANVPLCMWAHMEYPGRINAEISVDRNTLSGFKDTARQMRERYKIDEQTSKADARKIITEAFLAQGRRIDSSSSEYNGEPGIFVCDGKPQNIVLLYVQELTKEYGRHILKKFEEQDSDYSKTMFVVCAPGSFSGGVNGVQCGMFAHAGFVMAGGFGTTSEAWRALEHGDYQGTINVRPVPFQREQETNANRMAEHFAATDGARQRVVVSTDHDWADQFDRIVQDGIARRPTGDMSHFFAAVETGRSNAEHTKKLLFNEEEPTPTERKMNIALADARRDNVSNATFRLLTKVLMPTLGTIRNNGGILDQPFEFLITRKDGVKKMGDIDELIKTLGDQGRLSDLLGVRVEHTDFGIYKDDIVEALEIMKTQSPHVRVMHAQVILRQLNEGLLAGS